MTPDEVSAELVAVFERGFLATGREFTGVTTAMFRDGLAAVLTEHKKQVREQVARDIEARVTRHREKAAQLDEGDRADRLEAIGWHATAAHLQEAAEIARGEAWAMNEQPSAVKWVGVPPVKASRRGQGATAHGLLERLRGLGLDLPDGAALRSTYAPRSERANGAWSWFAVAADGTELHVGGHGPMRESFKARRLVAGRGDGDPDITIEPTSDIETPGGTWISRRYGYSLYEIQEKE